MAQLRFRPIDRLNEEWAALAPSPSSCDALARLAAREPTVAALGVDDLGSLVERLRTARGTQGRANAARVFQAMLRSQSAHPLLPRAVLQAVVPGLVTVARRLAWGAGGDWEDGGAFFADLVATTWEVIVDWSGEDRAYAVLDLLSAVRCRMRRQLLRQRDGRSRLELGLESHDDLLGSGGIEATDLELLAGAIEDLRGHGLEAADAAVLYGHRVLGLSIAELAALTGRSRRHLTQSRQRAEQQLCA
ncbi:MAG TPA: hypothetical protein VGG23_01435 [Acidimicrobiales bacterium]|jgi:hypothetical protein